METVERKTMDIFLPIDVKKATEQANNTDTENIYVSGFASTPDLDMQGEIVVPSGIDISYFQEHGWINFEHEQGAEYVIGVPTEKCYVDMEKGLFIEAKLFRDNPYTQQIIELAKNLEKSGTSRKLGFSIEGAIKQRNIDKEHIIEEVMITNVAVTKSPANTSSSWNYFMKSLNKAFTTGHSTTPETQTGASAIRQEALAQSITRLSSVLNMQDTQMIEDTWKSVTDLLEQGNRMDYNTAILTLQIAKGLSRKDAELAVLKIREENLKNG